MIFTKDKKGRKPGRREEYDGNILAGRGRSAHCHRDADVGFDFYLVCRRVLCRIYRCFFWSRSGRAGDFMSARIHYPVDFHQTFGGKTS